MQILELRDIPPSMLPQLAALKWLDGDTPQDAAFVREIRELGYPASPYFGLYATEAGELLGRVETLRVPFRSKKGSQVVAVLSDVATRPDSLGRGIARNLLNAVHRRERSAGVRWAFLWTRRSWGAHSLYKKLGYQDVFTPPSALKKIELAAGSKARVRFRWRRANLSDAGLLERLLHVSTRHRLGFVPRFRGSFVQKHRVGWRPIGKHRILYDGSTPVGYAYVSPTPSSLEAFEVVVSDREYSVPMIAALQEEARNRWLAFGTTTFVRDTESELLRQGYRIYTTHHLTLMARPLVSGSRVDERAGPAATCADRRYSCHRGDVF